MAVPLRLPRLLSNQAIVDSLGRPTNFFLRLFNIDLAERLEQSALDTALIQEQLAAQLILIEQALELAGIAIGQGPGNNGTATAVATVNDVGWTLGPVVNLTGVVAGDLTIPSSGLYASASTTSYFGQFSGQLRLVEIVGGVDTVIGGPWTFVVNRPEPSPTGTVFIYNPAEINTFTLARATTGAVGYRIDAITTDGVIITNVSIKTFVSRTT